MRNSKRAVVTESTEEARRVLIRPKRPRDRNIFQSAFNRRGHKDETMTTPAFSILCARACRAEGLAKAGGQLSVVRCQWSF